MAEFNLIAPETGLVAPTSWGSRTQIKSMLQKIITNYGEYIKWVSKLTNIPPEMIVAFIAVESGGNATAGGTGHPTQGLMQWNRQYAAAFLEAEKRLGRLSQLEEDELKKFGIVFNNGKVRAITNADQVNAKLNILIGSILLGQYIDSYFDAGKGGKSVKEWGTENDKIRLDRIIAVYNSGAYGDAGKKARSATHKTPEALANDVNPITRSYINKILGANGALDILSSDLKDSLA